MSTSTLDSSIGTREKISNHFEVPGSLLEMRDVRALLEDGQLGAGDAVVKRRSANRSHFVESPAGD
jgi:hypothetical protein